jgi:glycosyltransferase involved in cell wall biosynthesis
MKHVLILEALTDIAGGQAVLLDLAPALSATYQVSALIPGQGALQQALQAAGIPSQYAPMANYQLVGKGRSDLWRFALDTPRLALTAYRHIKRQHIDLVYGNNSRTLVWGTLGAALARRPIIWHIHNLFQDAKTLRLLTYLARWPTVRSIICASPLAAQQFMQVPSAKLKAIPAGVDLHRFAPDPAARERYRSAHSLGAQVPLIGIVGDLIPLKGHTTFIEAAALIYKNQPEAHYWIVGRARPTEESHAYQARLQQLATGLPIEFLGYQADMSGILNALDILVIASTTETGPLVLLEALASGVPVLSTPVGRASDLLSDGTCGQLVPIGSADTLARQLNGLLDDRQQRQAMSQAARHCARRQLSLEDFQARVLAEIKSALE